MPLSNETFDPSEIISLANDEMLVSVLKVLLATRGGYYSFYEDFASNQTGLYLIPSDATAGALENVEIVQNETIIQVSQVEESEQFSTNSPTSTSYSFFMKGNYVQILPIPPVGDVRLWFSKRPSLIVPISACGRITVIDVSVPGFTTLTLSNVPSTFVVDGLLDVVGDQPPFNIFGDGVVSAISGTDVTLIGEITEVTVGDWLCLHNQTCIPQVPVEFRPVLEQSVVRIVYELQGMEKKATTAGNKLKELISDVKTLITPRVKSQTKIVNPVNGGFLSGNQNRYSNFMASKNQ